jgi:hypothetical protein
VRLHPFPNRANAFNLFRISYHYQFKILPYPFRVFVLHSQFQIQYNGKDYFSLPTCLLEMRSALGLNRSS